MFDGKLVRINPSLNPERARVWSLHRIPPEDLEGVATKTTPHTDGTPLYLVNDWYVPETVLELAGTAVPCTEAVEHPPHYNTGKIEVIDFIEDQGLNFNLGNVVKYVTRADHKGNRTEDLQKAKFYLEREIERAELT